MHHHRLFASVNLNTVHPVGYGLTSAVPTLRSSAEAKYSDQRSDEGADDVAARQRKRRTTDEADGAQRSSNLARTDH